LSVDLGTSGNLWWVGKGSDISATLKGAEKGDFIRKFQLTSHRDAVGKSGDTNL
jgi:hypothetical protein